MNGLNLLLLLIAGWDDYELFCSETERRCSSSMVTENLKTTGHWSQRSLSQSLQQAEVLLRNTFPHPNLRWLFHVRSQHEEDNFVVADNLVSRSSARLLHLQQALLTVASQWQLSDAHMESSQGHYRNLWKLLEQRSLLLFTHEYTRRAHLTAAYNARVRYLLAHKLKKFHLTHSQTPSSFRIGLCSLSQELRVHLSHWYCLFSKVQSDHYLRPALVRTGLLMEVKQALDLLTLQALVLMEHYVYAVLTAIAQTELDSVEREVLEDILTGAELYNQAVEEHRLEHSVTELRTVVLQQAHYSLLDSSLPAIKRTHPSALSAKELMLILAVHHTETVAKQLHHWASGQSCQVHTCTDKFISQLSRQGFRIPKLGSELPREKLQCFQNFSLPPSYKTTDNAPSCHPVSNVLQNYHVLVKPLSVQHRAEGWQTNAEVVELSRVWQRKLSSIKLLFQVLVSSSDLLASRILHTSASEEEAEKPLRATGTNPLIGNSVMEILYPPIINTAASVELDATEKGHNIEGTPLEQTDLDLTRPDVNERLGSQKDRDITKEIVGGATVEPHCVHLPHSVHWLDLGQSFVFADLLAQYHALLRTVSRKALWLTLHVPQIGKTTGSINLQNNHRHFHILHKINQATEAGLVPNDCKAMLETFTLELLFTIACVYWDCVVCQSLGLTLKDKCIISKQDGRAIMSLTMEHFLLLPHPLLSTLCYLQSHYKASGSFSVIPSTCTQQRHIVSLVLASVHLSAVWVTSKAYQFLSSWSLNKFLLITQGDLKMLQESVEMLPHQIESLVNTGSNSTLPKHNQLLLRQQLEALDRAVSELQTFAFLMLKIFSSDCKRRSGEIFEQTMPSAVHWRACHKTDFPSSPNEYAYVAAQTIIGQVLEGVSPLTDDARLQALSITMTAFLEAWMEHIIKHHLKFSVQGALQLKQDFDFIREMVQSDEYSLSAELQQRILSLRVFQQVDSAVLCLLQQPQAEPYLPSRVLESFTRCCLFNNRDSVDAAIENSITNLRCMVGEDISQFYPSGVTTEFASVNPSNPAEPYLATSLALGASQQEWLNLRIQRSSSNHRWKLLGLQCLCKSEP